LSAFTTAAAKADTIVLLHGLGRSSASMLVLKHRLEGEGYRVISESYASTDQEIDDHTQWLKGVLTRCCSSGSGATHFVTHSLGGIVLRQYLAGNELPDLGRVVMLAPPNQGSELADFFMNSDLYKSLAGPTGQQLGTDAGSIPNILRPVDFELGVIAGDFSYIPWTSRLIPGPDDGVVAVDRARIAGMSDFLVVDSSHSFIMNSKEVASEVISFIQTGSFTRHSSIQK
jgi:pimeloyl-ACP methyl ester carboxylesterase